MAVQFMRIPSVRNHIAQTSDYFLKVMSRNIANQMNAEGLHVSVPPEYHAHVHLTMLNDINMLHQIADILSKKYTWILGINTTDMPLYTSDVPIARKGHLGKNGLLSKGVEITYPISSKHIIVCYEKSSFDLRRKSDCRARLLNDENVDWYNTFQIAQSERYIYCSQDTFDFAEQLCNEYPDFCKPKKLLISGGGL